MFFGSKTVDIICK